MAKKTDFYQSSPSKFFTFSKIHLAPKYRTTTGNWQSMKMKYIPVVHIDGIITALCAYVFDGQVFLVNLPPKNMGYYGV